MSDPLLSNQPSAIDDDSEEEGLLFARCSQPPSEADTDASLKGKEGKNKAKNAEKTKSTTVAVANAELPLHHAGNLPNLRRSHLTYRHLVISLSTSLIVGLAVLYVGRWFYVKEIEPRLAGAVVPVAAPSGGASLPQGPALEDELAKSAEQILALQKQVDVMRREQLIMQQNTRESLENISTTLKNPQLVSAPVAASTDKPGVPRLADVKPDVSPTQQEFIQLKERNRLTQYADEAIATGMRRPLEVLVEYMRDPDGKHLHDAAKAEFMRAVRAIQLLQREDPGFRLPVAELFKDGSIRDEADVKPEALLKLLADYNQPWEVRLRVCFLLLGSPLPETNAQLIKTIKEDPSLDVAKHAQLALEQRLKKRFRIFDIPAIEEWVKTQGK